MRCSGQDKGCCTTSTPCSIGEGDCDSDADCVGGLQCGKDNCPWGDLDDCCTGICLYVVLSLTVICIFVYLYESIVSAFVHPYMYVDMRKPSLVYNYRYAR